MTNKNAIHILSRAVIIDKGHLLLCKTLDLPQSFYFLPGGHVEHGESAEAAVVREVLEESGAYCSLKRFLGILEHSFEPGHNSICHNHEYNLIFEAESPAQKRTIPMIQQEDHIQLLWVPLSTLNGIDFKPEPLKALLPQWLQDFTSERFRSAMR